MCVCMCVCMCVLLGYIFILLNQCWCTYHTCPSHAPRAFWWTTGLHAHQTPYIEKYSRSRRSHKFRICSFACRSEISIICFPGIVFLTPLPLSLYHCFKSGAWLGKDIVLTLQFGHFNLCEPIGENIVDRPIDTILEKAVRGDFSISRPMDFFGPSFIESERVSLMQTLENLLGNP